MARSRRTGQGRPYGALGRVMDGLARELDVRGPHRIANYMEEKVGGASTGTAVAKWMYGDAEPKPDKIRMFAEVFELDEDEKVRLALAYTYGDKAPEIA